MNPIDIVVPNNWLGLKVELKGITTTGDNEILHNGDVVLTAKLDGENPKDYIKDGDILLLNSDNDEFDSHAYKYSKTVNEKGCVHQFAPISKFLGRQAFDCESLDDVEILGKIICAFKPVSEGMNFKTYKE